MDVSQWQSLSWAGLRLPSRTFRNFSEPVFASDRGRIALCPSKGSADLKLLRLVFVVVVALLASQPPLEAHANHSWQGFHWAHTASPVSLVVLDRTPSGSDLSAVVGEVVRGWSAGPIRLTAQRDARTGCGGVLGKIVVCSGAFLESCGNTFAWAGCASIDVDQSTGHISSAMVKLNLPVLQAGLISAGPSIWLSPAARKGVFRAVVYQEIGHALGLDHSVERSSVMFPMWSPSEAHARGLSRHDFDELRQLYAHLDRSIAARRTITFQFVTRFR